MSESIQKYFKCECQFVDLYSASTSRLP